MPVRGDAVVVREPNPTVARRELAAALRRAREAHAHTYEELARFLGVTLPQASRLDSGARGFRPDDVARLVAWYGVGAREGDRLVELAHEARKRAWWQQIDLPDAYRTLIGHEQAARSIFEYGGTVVPGLLQTPDYSRAVALNSYVQHPPEVVDRAVAVRMRRQAILDRPSPPHLRVIVDEVALARGPHDPAAKRAQLEHLVTMSARTHVAIRVIGFEYGLHPGDRRHFILLGMPTAPDLVYSDGLLEPVVVESAQDIARYEGLWNELQGVALDQHASLDRIKHHLG